jgi:hypothetical protein
MNQGENQMLNTVKKGILVDQVRKNVIQIHPIGHVCTFLQNIKTSR